MTRPNPTSVQGAQALHSRQQALESRVLLLAPSFGYWRGYYQLGGDHVAVSVEENTVDNDSVTVPRAVLLGQSWPTDSHDIPWRKRFQKIESRQKAVIEKFSVPFPIRGIRIVPKAAGERFFDALFGMTIGSLRRRIRRLQETDSEHEERERLQGILENATYGNLDITPVTPVRDPMRGDDQSVVYLLHVAAEEFVRDLEGALQQIQRHLDPRVWENVQHKIPRAPEKMRAKFYVDAVPIELAGGGSNRVTAEDLTEHSRRIRDSLDRKVDDAIEEMIRGPRVQLAEALAGLQTLIHADGRVTSRSFNPVRAAIEKLRLFNFTDDRALAEQIANFEHRLDSTVPSDLDRVTAANNGFSAALGSFRNEVESAQAIALGLQSFSGREVRDIDLGE